MHLHHGKLLESDGRRKETENEKERRRDRKRITGLVMSDTLFFDLTIITGRIYCDGIKLGVGMNTP